ncbi:MAG: creatininase family protein [Alphaproteobacteria bacterium]|nr:MAG: creatininase family protein [Alphaproteobacteria bacterium]
MDLLLSTWKDVEAYLVGCKGIIVPLGSIEQHGPNGLIGTDVLCPQQIAQGIAAAAGALVGPAIAFGVSPFNLAFPGTISARAATLMGLIEDYVGSLARQGFEQFYFLNGHGGNIGPVQAACQDLHAARSFTPGAASGRMRLRLRNWWEYPSVSRMRRELYGEWEGMHATPSEIAITQALYPGCVKAQEMAPAQKLSPEFLRDHAGDNHGGAEEHRRRFPDGRVGSDPSLAKPEHGHRLLAAAVADAIADYAAFLAEA